MKIHSGKTILAVVSGKRTVDLFVHRIESTETWLWSTGRTYETEEGSVRIAKAGRGRTWLTAFRAAMRSADRLMRARTAEAAERLKP
jgi:hypothetical protein